MPFNEMFLYGAEEMIFKHACAALTDRSIQLTVINLEAQKIPFRPQASHQNVCMLAVSLMDTA